MQPAGPRVQRRARRQDCRERDRRPTSPRTPGWRNASKSPDEMRMWLNETLASGMAPLLPFRRRGDGLRRGSPLAKGGRGLLSLDCAPRCAPGHAPLHRQYRRRHRAEHATALSGPVVGAQPHLHARDHEGHLRRAAARPLRVRLRARGSARRRAAERNIARCCCPTSRCSATGSASSSAIMCAPAAR